MGHMVKNLPTMKGDAGDLGLIPGLGRCSDEGKGFPLHYSGLENSMDCIVHGKSQTQLSDFQVQVQFHVFISFLIPGF